MQDSHVRILWNGLKDLSENYKCFICENHLWSNHWYTCGAFRFRPREKFNRRWKTFSRCTSHCHQRGLDPVIVLDIKISVPIRQHRKRTQMNLSAAIWTNAKVRREKEKQHQIQTIMTLGRMTWKHCGMVRVKFRRFIQRHLRRQDLDSLQLGHSRIN